MVGELFLPVFKILFLVSVCLFVFVLVVLGFELRALGLLGN
jgi:hypothetical protein